jgi:hypothetical protein
MRSENIAASRGSLNGIPRGASEQPLYVPILLCALTGTVNAYRRPREACPPTVQASQPFVEAQ